MECTVENNKLVPLSRAVNASIVDQYGDIGRQEQRHSFWGARELKEVYVQSLPKLKHKVWLTVNESTHTATLPLDFDEEYFIGFIDSNWHKVPLKLNNNLTDSRNIIDVPCEDKCPKCNQDLGICNDLIVTEETNLMVVNDLPYNQTIIKKLYPNGDYYLETTTPVWDYDTDTVIYFTKKEFIVNFDLKPCGCLEDNAVNTANLIAHCPDIYCNHFAPCDSQCNTQVGGYKIFEETGLIQMDATYPYEKVYIEYYGFITKIKGQYYVPQIAFETIVEGIKYRSIKNRKNVLRWQILDQKESWREAKANMNRILGRASLTRITQAISLIPKFDIDYGYGDYLSCFATQDSFTLPATASNIANAAAIAACVGGNGSGGSSNVTNNYITIINNYDFTIATIVAGQPGQPVSQTYTYQNNLLIGASVQVDYIIVNNAVENKLAGEFTFDNTTGTITRPNLWFPNDTLIINYNKTVTT